MKPIRSRQRPKVQPANRGNADLRPVGIPAGVVGMGLMGTSIAACLLMAGHPVAALEADAGKRRTGVVMRSVTRVRAREVPALAADGFLTAFHAAGSAGRYRCNGAIYADI